MAADSASLGRRQLSFILALATRTQSCPGSKQCQRPSSPHQLCSLQQHRRANFSHNNAELPAFSRTVPQDFFSMLFTTTYTVTASRQWFSCTAYASAVPLEPSELLMAFSTAVRIWSSSTPNQ